MDSQQIAAGILSLTAPSVAGWKGDARRAMARTRVVQGALECLEELGWIRGEAVRGPAGGRPSVRFHINPRLRGAR